MLLFAFLKYFTQPPSKEDPSVISSSIPLRRIQAVFDSGSVMEGEPIHKNKTSGERNQRSIRGSAVDRSCQAEGMDIWKFWCKLKRMTSSTLLFGMRNLCDLYWLLHKQSDFKDCRKLKKFSTSPLTLINFYRCTIESVLSGYKAALFDNCSLHVTTRNYMEMLVQLSISQEPAFPPRTQTTFLATSVKHSA
ncbi:uncharacterized protein [Mobula birostris]|uniref:uncharacterized protein isoform X2 n=1 Tax=Mobula birostris TaxID=1983395 RepID=UPI003B27E271